MTQRQRRDFCLWLVPSHDGRVRKVRFSFLRAAGVALAVGLGFGALIFIAGDYGRVQMLRAKNFISLQLAEREKSHLLKANKSLNDELKTLKSAHDRVLSYEQNLKQRVDELALVLDSAAALGVVDSEKNFPLEIAGPKARYTGSAGKRMAKAGVKSGAGLKDGIGGAELDCSQEGAACRRVALVNGGLGDADDQEAPQFTEAQLVSLLDHYIDVLKTVPLGIPAVGHVSSGFGYRLSPFAGTVRLHEGVDFSLTNGSYVYGSADGVVKEVRRCSTYGLLVDIQHSDGVVTRYAHLSKALVREGERVCRGEVVGLAGSTGHSTGPHLHYEIRVNGEPRNPIQFLQLAQKLSGVL